MKIFISGIDTDSGKSIVTGLIAKYLLSQNRTVITQKYVQTGCVGMAEDLETHRKIMACDFFTEDKNGITCSYLFKYPASPHLSAKMENTLINPNKFTEASKVLDEKYEFVLMEGAGGLMVPLNKETLLIDYIQQEEYPVVLVASSKLGSINHTLLSLEVLQKRKINLLAVVYNHFPNTDQKISLDSEKMIEKYLHSYFPKAAFVSVPKIDLNNPPLIDFDFINDSINLSLI